MQNVRGEHVCECANAFIQTEWTIRVIIFSLLLLRYYGEAVSMTIIVSVCVRAWSSRPHGVRACVWTLGTEHIESNTRTPSAQWY